jgi:hypothetical protein
MKWLKLGAIISVGLLLLVGSMTAVSFLGDPFGIQERRTENAVADALKAKGDAATSDAQSGVGLDWSKITANAATREGRLAVIGTTNAQQIQKAQGANTPLTDDYIASINAGLCNYESTPCPSGS